MSQTIATFAFQGGLDTNSAALAVDPGAVISAMNYEPLAEGYGRSVGFERFDGQTAPSDAVFWSIDFDAGSISFVYGDTVTGATSGATGVVIANPYDVTGTWAGSDAAGTLVLANVSGTFEDNEDLEVSAVVNAVANGAATQGGAPTAALANTWELAAIAWHRAQIAKVPGEGAVRGVAVHSGNVYAWRDNVGATRCDGFVSSTTGWQALGVLHRMEFTAGTGDGLNEGDAIEGATSGATATVVHVQIESGTYAGSDAAGFVFLSDVSGVFAAESLEVLGAGVATGAASVAQYAAAGGRFRTISHNFYGASNRYRLYGVNGTGPAFELFTEGLALIDTGMVIDTPERVFEIGNHLGLCFPGGSVQISGSSDPQAWTVILGAGEIGLGTDITDVVQANETAVAIFGETKIGILQGHDSSDFLFDTLTEEAGADADSAQRISRTVYVDRRGLRSLDATQAFGNFKAGALSGKFERYFRVKRAAGAAVIGSFVSKSKSQYRMIWDDGTGLSVYMGGKEPEALPFSLDDMRPSCFGAGELADGEGIFCGGEDGYVYRLDKGNSFDGTQIQAYVMTPFNHFGSPNQDFRYHWVALEMDAPASASIAITMQFDYGDGYQPISGNSDLTAIGGDNSFLVSGGGGLWDTAVWDEFYWSSPVESRAEAFVDGIGRNASFIFATTAELNEDPHILQAYQVARTPRKMRRGAGL